MDEVNEISTVEVEGLMKANKQIAIIDVREAEEVTSGMISEAVHIPMGEIPHAISSFDKNKHYILVCRSGARSDTVARYLMNKGYHASNMEGGMIDWRGEIIILETVYSVFKISVDKLINT